MKQSQIAMPFRTRMLLGILAVTLTSIAVFFAGSTRFVVRMAEKNYARTVTGPMASQAARFDDAMRDAYRTAVRAANDGELRRQGQPMRRWTHLQPSMRSCFPTGSLRCGIPRSRRTARRCTCPVGSR